MLCRREKDWKIYIDRIGWKQDYDAEDQCWNHIKKKYCIEYELKDLVVNSPFYK